MDTRRIKKLIELVKETGIGELEVKSGDDSVRISCQSTYQPTVNAPAPAPVVQASNPHQTPENLATTPTTPSPDNNNPTGYTQKSPMVGTVYLAATPGDKPFVDIGQHINIGDTLCIIEAMKMFNKIEADTSGIISARLIDNESPIEFDQPLFIIDPD